MEGKQEIRERILEMRRQTPSLALMQKSGIICKKLTTLPMYREAKTIYTYVSFDGEVATDPLIETAWRDGKTVAVPKVVGSDTLKFIELESWDQLQEGYFHVMEPTRGRAASDRQALVVMPGVAFDETCHRIGYGKGFYDRFLLAEREHPTVALAFEFSVLSEIPYEGHDQIPDLLVTDRRIFYRAK